MMTSGPLRGLLAVCALIFYIGCSKAKVSLPFQCSFESDDLCGMILRTQGQFYWKRHNGTTPSADTGPHIAKDRNYYIYIEATDHSPLEKASIETPQISYDGTICVQFWYHMFTKYPRNMGRLVVFIDRQGEGKSLFNEGGESKGVQWIPQQITVTEFQNDDKIVFLNEDGTEFRGDMALDMIYIQGGVCDACDVNDGGCDTRCVPDGEGRRCECDVGYHLDNDGVTCIDDNECEANGDRIGCSDTCDNTPGSYTCICPTGYDLGPDGRTCRDIDECAVNGGKGDCGHQCDNTDGSYRCRCNSGYTLIGDQKSCDDINECSANGGNGPCDVTCMNNEGSFTCSCPDGQYLQNDGKKCAAETPEPTTPTTTPTTTTPATPTSPPSTSDEPQANTAAMAAGGVVGGLAIIAVIVVVVLVVLRRKRRRDRGGGSPSGLPGGSFSVPFGSRMKDTGADPEYQNGPSGSRRVTPDVVPTPEILQAKKPPKPIKPANGLSLPVTGLGGRMREKVPSVDSLNSLDDPKPAPAEASPKVKPEMLSPIEKEQFPTMVATKKEKEAFKDEFKSLPLDVHNTIDALDKTLKNKNRFKNILPYDYNRVHLDEMDDEPHSDYINASFVQLYKEDETFIASHGPTQHTINDFWRMIWEKDVLLVVMLTNPVENGVLKCEQYWPEEGPEIYGSVSVQPSDVERHVDYTVRTFRLQLDDAKALGKRALKQLHFTTWPDHGVPGDVTAVLRFHKSMRQSMVPGKPTVIHCSAGVGRTGTLMAIDYLRHQMEQEGRLSVYKCVEHLRGQRNHMVQSQKQYVLIHDALAEMVTLGDTSVPCANFRDAVTEQAMTKQFKRLQTDKYVLTGEDKSQALSKQNKAKNMSQSILPRISKKVHLTGRVPGRNTYINAVFCNGSLATDSFIATQTPLMETQIDFWRLIHDYRCRSVLLLDSQVQDLLPEEESVKKLSPYTIVMTSPKSDVTRGGTVCQLRICKSSMKGTAAETDYINNQDVARMKDDVPAESPDDVICKVFNCTVDAYTDLDATLLSQLYDHVQTWEKSGHNTATIVASRDGAELCGMAIAFFSLLEMMMSSEHNVDVYHVVKRIKDSRPEFVSSLGQYQYLHALIADYTERFLEY